ncbi:MAG: hypothetical protein KIT31_41550, partial [Deltaproteobacteria bacterium]|nr:hypothetical protein [Deltaproteobacteria bacterium]
GVGLGLPYTGPSGEPIFGLTPEERLAQVSARTARGDMSMASALEPEPATTPVGRSERKRWPIYAAIAALAIAGGITAALVIGGRGGGGDGDEPEKPEPSAVAREAAVLLDEKADIDGTIRLLEGQRDAIANDADAQLILGHAYSGRFEKAKVLEAYARAMSLRREVEADPKLRGTLRTMAANQDPSVAAAAFDLWVRTNDASAKKALANAAVSDSMERRHAMLPVLEKHKLMNTVELWLVYARDLEDEPSCEERKKIVGKLRVLGDPRAVSALERAIERRAKGVPKGRYNWCLLDEATAAIGYLNTQPPK